MLDVAVIVPPEPLSSLHRSYRLFRAPTIGMPSQFILQPILDLPKMCMEAHVETEIVCYVADGQGCIVNSGLDHWRSR